jgi:hypothetical protein
MEWNSGVASGLDHAGSSPSHLQIMGARWAGSIMMQKRLVGKT